MQLQGKRALITGIASQHSIAHGIAQVMHEQGAELALTYQHEKLKKRLLSFGECWHTDKIYPLDVSSDQEIQTLFESLNRAWPEGFDILVHAIAFAPANELSGNYVKTATRDGFREAHDISSFSLTALAQAGFNALQKRQGNILTLTYEGSSRVMTNYNVMGLAKASLEANIKYLANAMGPEGIRVNGISAGPIRTLAASGIKSFRELLKHHEKTTPLRRNVTTKEVGQTAAFLCSDAASGITGEVIHVDAGHQIQANAPIDLVEK